MLMDVVALLRESGIEVDRVEAEPLLGGRTRPDAVLTVAAGSARATFAVEEKRRAPYPNELDRIVAQCRALQDVGVPLLVVPFVSEALGPVLTRSGLSWADTQGNFDLRANGMTLRQRRTSTPPKPDRRTLPQGSGSLAIIRSLIRFGAGEEEEPRATSLAAQARVSQPRASQVLHQLLDLNLVTKSVGGRWIPDREALLDRFLDEYTGPRGSERHLYGLDSLIDIALSAAASSPPDRPTVISADVGPDLVKAWRRPSVLILYASHEIDPAALGLVEAHRREDANVIIRNVDDRSVFPYPRLVVDVRGTEVPLADPSQMIWDLKDLGGTDRLEAAGELREWLLSLH